MRTKGYKYWNKDKEIQDFPARVTITLQKDVNVPTDMYNEYIEEHDGNETFVIETSQVDWTQEYRTNCITILDMLHEFQNLIKKELQDSNTTLPRERYLYKLLDASAGWVEKNIDVDEL